MVVSVVSMDFCRDRESMRILERQIILLDCSIRLWNWQLGFSVDEENWTVFVGNAEVDLYLI